MMIRSRDSKTRVWMLCAVGIAAIAIVGCCDCEDTVENSGSDENEVMAAVDHYYAISPDCTVHCTASGGIVDPDGGFEVARNDKVMFINFYDYALDLTLTYDSGEVDPYPIPRKSAVVIKIKQIPSEPGPDIKVDWQKAASAEPPHGGPRMIVRP